jgi:hypothetical protein|nr:MAG TPA: hypothetical protein [Caudoviricetes sp.]
MNNDLISREALLEAIRTDVAPFTLSMVFRHIHSAPAVDAVEVVRCRECRNHIHDDDVDFLCTITGVYTRHDDFCSYGERRADNG